MSLRKPIVSEDEKSAQKYMRFDKNKREKQLTNLNEGEEEEDDSSEDDEGGSSKAVIIKVAIVIIIFMIIGGACFGVYMMYFNKGEDHHGPPH